MNRVIELKPCPFCGSKASQPERVDQSGRPRWCIGCSLFCAQIYRSTKKDAIESWNRRIKS